MQETVVYNFDISADVENPHKTRLEAEAKAKAVLQSNDFVITVQFYHPDEERTEDPLGGDGVVIKESELRASCQAVLHPSAPTPAFG